MKETNPSKKAYFINNKGDLWVCHVTRQRFSRVTLFSCASLRATLALGMVYNEYLKTLNMLGSFFRSMFLAAF